MNIDADNPSDRDPSDGSEPRPMPVFDIRRLSPQQLAQLGLTQIAYVRPVVAGGEAAFAIHAADGTPMALAANEEVALAAIRQHEMLPALLH